MTVRIEKPAINVREELADLRKPSGVAGEAMLRADTPQEQFNLIGAGRRNWIINGDFQVSQRGDYTSATAITTSATYYVDRWAALIFAGNNGTIQKATNQTLPNGSITDSLKLVSNVSGGTYALWQWVEDYKAFRGQEATLSFWYKSNCDQSFNYYTYAAQTHVGLPNTNGQWVYFTHTRKHEANATGMRVEFYPLGLSLPSSAYIEIAQFQLELGKVATPFEHRSYGEELALCQRYFLQYDYTEFTAIGALWSGGHYASLNFPTTMRAYPTCTNSGAGSFRVFGGGASTESTAVSYTSISKNGVEIVITNTRTNEAVFVRLDSSGDYQRFDAEL